MSRSPSLWGPSNTKWHPRQRRHLSQLCHVHFLNGHDVSYNQGHVDQPYLPSPPTLVDSAGGTIMYLIFHLLDRMLESLVVCPSSYTQLSWSFCTDITVDWKYVAEISRQEGATTAINKGVGCGSTTLRLAPGGLFPVSSLFTNVVT